MDIRKLQRAIVDGLEDVKAQNIVVFNTEHLSPLFERVIIASGTSNRQTKALAASVRDAVKKGGMQVMRTEGEDNGEWIIVDCGAAVAHIMQPGIREYYHLEEIWGGKPVKLKLGAADKGGLVKASEPLDDDEDAELEDEAPKAAKSTARKSASGKTAAAKSPARRSATEQTAAGKVATKRAAPARSSAAKSPARKSAPAKSPSSRTSTGTRSASAPAKKAPAKKAAAKSTSAGKAGAARKTPSAKSAPAKTAARKSPARKTGG